MRTLLLTMLLGLYIQQAPPADLGSIAGTVVQNSGAAPIPDASVLLAETLSGVTIPISPADQ